MKIKNLFIVLVVLGILLIAVGCAKQAPAPAPAPQPAAAQPQAAPEPGPVVEEKKEEVKPVEVKQPEAPKSGDVVMTDTGFEPAELTVSVGAKVTWENKAKKSMLVLEKGGLFMGIGKTTASGGKWDYTFTKAGTFELFNKIGTQKGKVIVK